MSSRVLAALAVLALLVAPATWASDGDLLTEKSGYGVFCRTNYICDSDTAAGGDPITCDVFDHNADDGGMGQFTDINLAEDEGCGVTFQVLITTYDVDGQDEHTVGVLSDSTTKIVDDVLTLDRKVKAVSSNTAGCSDIDVTITRCWFKEFKIHSSGD